MATEHLTSTMLMTFSVITKITKMVTEPYTLSMEQKFNNKGPRSICLLMCMEAEYSCFTITKNRKNSYRTLVIAHWI